MSVENSALSRLFRWFVTPGIDSENPMPLEKATATDLQFSGLPKNDGEPSEDQRIQDSDHERELLLMLHTCC